MKNWIEYNSNNSDIVLNSSVKILRNFKNQNFLNKQSFIESKGNIDKVFDFLSGELKDENFTLIKVSKWNKDEAQVYLDKELVTKELLKKRDDGALIYNESNTLSLLLNEEEQIGIKCISVGLDFNSEYEYATKIEELIGTKFKYAFHQDFGFLTMNTNHLGTGLILSAVIHLPILTYNKKIDSIKKNLFEEGITIKALYEEDSKCYGNLYSISNKSTLGKSEEEIISNMKKYIFELIEEEKRARDEIISKSEIDLQDRILKSYGTLRYAMKLNSMESLQIISDVMLGVELNILNLDKKLIKEIIIMSRDSNIRRKFQTNKEIINYDVERCNIIKEILNET